MSKIKPVLGRGLDALIKPQNYNEQERIINSSQISRDDHLQVDVIANININSVSPNPYQPRMNFDPAALEELKKSILENGLIQPITVRRLPDNQYQLISGERRLKACKDIGYNDIPAYIIKVDTEEAMLAMALIENIQREKLNPIEIGHAYKRLMDECGLTQEQIADKVGKDRTTIANTVRLLKLPNDIQKCLIEEDITPGHARALINLPGERLQLEVLQKIREKNLSVRKVEQLVKKILSGQTDEKRMKSTLTVKASGIADVEDKLRKIFGTKVSCKVKSNGSGEIVIEFYSNDELERLFELFDVISKTYN
jgi:ParB family transcriptional regulator, chromosome partitioning protein